MSCGNDAELLDECMDRVGELEAELEHAREAFTKPQLELDKDHCAWCRRAWMANWRR